MKRFAGVEFKRPGRRTGKIQTHLGLDKIDFILNGDSGYPKMKEEVLLSLRRHYYGAIFVITEKEILAEHWGLTKIQQLPENIIPHFSCLYLFERREVLIDLMEGALEREVKESKGGWVDDFISTPRFRLKNVFGVDDPQKLAIRELEREAERAMEEIRGIEGLEENADQLLLEFAKEELERSMRKS